MTHAPGRPARRHAPKSQWVTSNPVLGDGENVVATTTGEAYVGDGHTPFNELTPNLYDSVNRKAIRWAVNPDNDDTTPIHEARHMTAAEWAAENPLIGEWEMVFNSDDGRMKFGNHSTPAYWADLPYSTTRYVDVSDLDFTIDDYDGPS